MRRHIVLWLTSALLWQGASAGAQTLTLHYQERPPYSSVQSDGSVRGLVADPAADALRKAGIAFRWALTPGQRQLALVQSGTGLHCGLGWFYTDERATRGRFSAALYQDRPLMALVRNDRNERAAISAEALLGDRTLRLLVKDGYSYGPVLDRLIAQAPRAPLRTSVETLQMSQMVRSDRADWMIVSPEEADILSRRGLHLAVLTDVAVGPTRHVYCSADVPPNWISRIDQALATRPR